MPQIPSYEAPGPSRVEPHVGPSYAGAAAAPGRGLANLAEAIGDVGEKVYKAQVRDEMVQAHLKLTQARSEFTQRIEEDVASGVIDTQKVESDFQGYVNKSFEDISTTEGIDYFTTQSADLRAQLIRTSAQAQAQLKGKRMVENYQSSLNHAANGLMRDPANFAKDLEFNTKLIDKLEENGLPVEQTDKMRRLSREVIAQASVRGWMKISPNAAEHMLSSGTFDEYLDPDTKNKLFSEVRTQKTANEVDKNRQEKLAQESLKKERERWENDAIPKLRDLSLNPQDIIDSPLSPSRKITWLNMQKLALQKTLKTDYAVKNMLTRRILADDTDPERITDTTQLFDFVGKGITITDLNQLQRLLDKTPEGLRSRDNQKQLIKFAKDHLVKANPLMGIKDPDGEYQLSLFMDELRQTEDEWRKEGKNVADLYNPRSKDFFGNNVFKYKRSVSEQMKLGIQQNRKILTIPQSGDARKSTKDILKEVLGD